MPSVKYEIGAVSTLLSTELNALANGSAALSTTAYDNANVNNLFFWGDIELYVSFTVAPTANSVIELYLVAALDGTNFADGTAGAAPVVSMSHYRAGFPLRAVVGAQRIIVPGIVLPPQPFKAQIINRSGQAMAASGNLLRLDTYREQLV